MNQEIEILTLKMQLAMVQAQSLERDILVREYARLLGEAQELQGRINLLKEKENEKGDR
jgi:hypothetical protein